MPWCRAKRNVPLGTVSRCSRRCTNNRHLCTRSTRLLCCVYCMGGLCKIDQGISGLGVETERHLHLLQCDQLGIYVSPLYLYCAPTSPSCAPLMFFYWCVLIFFSVIIVMFFAFAAHRGLKHFFLVFFFTAIKLSGIR